MICFYYLVVLCQDSGIALKIFELALKRYGMQAECVWEYISFMARLNGSDLLYCLLYAFLLSYKHS